MSELRIGEILLKKDDLPRAQRTLCEFIAAHVNEVAMLTARQLAQAAGVGEATVFRFLKDLDYPSYAAFCGELHQYAIEYTQSSYWQMKGAIQLDSKERKGSALHQAVFSAVNLLEKTVTPKMEHNFDAAAALMLSATRVGVLGMRSSKPVAAYFYDLLLPFFPKVDQLGRDEHYIFEMLKNMPEGSVLLVITSWPNTKMVVRAAEFCRRLGHKIILLTNSLSCPIAAYADLLLIAPESREQYTVLPYIVVVEALARALGLRLAPDSVRKLQEMDVILAEQEVTNFKE